MKPIYARVLENEIFATRTIDRPYFSTEFHFHKECQLTYLVESEGKRIIGDSIETFGRDELILLGPDIPHVWHNDKAYFEKYTSDRHARSVALFFDPEKIVDLLSPFGNIKKLETLLQVSRLGMIFHGNAKADLKKLLVKIVKSDGFARIICLLEILDLLCYTKEYETVAGKGYINTYQTKDNERIDSVFRFIFDQFTREIDLNEVASLVYMNKQSFCRYFKSRTQKTFIEFVNEVRIAQACKLIANENNSIAALAYECGFNSLSNFNRIFKDVKGITPREYKKKLEE